MNLNDLKLSFDHSVQEMELILQGLRKLPMELVAELHGRLMLSAKTQVDEHIAKQQPSEPAPVEAPAETTIEAPAEQPQA